MVALTVRCARHAWLGTVLFLGVMLTTLPASGVVLAQVASGIGSPTDIQNARDGSGRLFFVQQTGQIKVWKNGVVLPTAFLNISSLIVAGGEQGLLGLAFHPDYRNNGLFYVNYTRSLDGATVVARYSRSATNPDVADPQSARCASGPMVTSISGWAMAARLTIRKIMHRTSPACWAKCCAST
jgi:hypothetical protein